VCFRRLAMLRLSAQSPPPAPATNQRSLEEVIRELEAMKQRVEQLKAMLKARLLDQGTTPLSAAHPRPSISAAAVPSGQAEQQHPTAQAAPGLDTTTPLAFADFTWLNLATSDGAILWTFDILGTLRRSMVFPPKAAPWVAPAPPWLKAWFSQELGIRGSRAAATVMSCWHSLWSE
jgi:hypothetical protein